LNPWTEGDGVKVITKDQAVLGVVEKYPATQVVFEQYDEQVGECICCNALFQTIEEVAAKYSSIWRDSWRISTGLRADDQRSSL
jgi:hypothetical protein